MSELQPRVALLKFAGINCDEETGKIFDQVGGRSEVVLDTDLLSGEKKLSDYQILALSGGFSYGDDLGSGTVAGLMLSTRLGDDVKRFVERGLGIGICNGFQIMVKSGLLPSGTLGERTATLDVSDSNMFKSDTVSLIPMVPNRCVFLNDLDSRKPIEMQNANKEGKFVTTPQMLAQLEESGQVVFRYADLNGLPTMEYPYNPNGSENAIAGITDPTGRLLGLMPHSERRRTTFNYPNARRYGEDFRPSGHIIFEKMVDYAKEGI